MQTEIDLSEDAETRSVDLLISTAGMEKHYPMYSSISRYIKVQSFAAVLFGWESAAILENLRQWISYARAKNNEYYHRSGRYWTRRSFNDLFADHFGIFSIRTLKSRISYLEKIGVLIPFNFNETYETRSGCIRKEQTKWYSISQQQINFYANQLTEYIQYMQENHSVYTSEGALTLISPKTSNGMGFIIYDEKSEKVGIAPKVIEEFGNPDEANSRKRKSRVYI